MACGAEQQGPRTHNRGQNRRPQSFPHHHAPNYWREASQRPLQGIPPDAPFHLPDPALPLSWPLAEAPLIETRTSPLLATVPDIGAPAAETLPSATVTG